LDGLRLFGHFNKGVGESFKMYDYFNSRPSYQAEAAVKTQARTYKLKKDSPNENSAIPKPRGHA
jgi:K+-transporting ATPase c subunit